VAELLAAEMARAAAYEEAMRSYLSRKPYLLRKGGKYPRRDELYDRPRVR
jgi:hypothetical protein